MIVGRQEVRGRSRRRGRPVAARPRVERVTIRLTREEWAAVQERARGVSVATYARNALLGRDALAWPIGVDPAQTWRTLDRLTDGLIRLEEEADARYDPADADSVLLDTLIRLGATLDDMRVLLVEAMGRVS